MRVKFRAPGPPVLASDTNSCQSVPGFRSRVSPAAPVITDGSKPVPGSSPAAAALRKSYWDRSAAGRGSSMLTPGGLFAPRLQSEVSLNLSSRPQFPFWAGACLISPQPPTPSSSWLTHRLTQTRLGTLQYVLLLSFMTPRPSHS